MSRFSALDKVLKEILEGILGKLTLQILEARFQKISGKQMAECLLANPGEFCEIMEQVFGESSDFILEILFRELFKKLNLLDADPREFIFLIRSGKIDKAHNILSRLVEVLGVCGGAGRPRDACPDRHPELR